MVSIWRNTKQWRMKFWIALIVVAAAGQGYAKDLDYSADVTSDAYWDAHHIAIVRVNASGQTERDGGYISYQVETQLSDGPIDRTRTVLLSHLWFGPDADETVRIAVNDRLILSYPKDGPATIVATIIDKDSAGLGTWNALLQIAALRANPGNLQA